MSWFPGWAAINKRAKKISRAESLNVVPIKNQAVSEKEDEEGNIILTLSRRQTVLIKVVFRIFFIPNPKEKNIKLDEIGSWVWRKCDGRTSVGEMIAQMSEEFKISKKEADTSLKSFLGSLMRKKLIAGELRGRKQD